jgi:CO dehydrogenase/acetyl-CoA synthase beta subunit
MELYNKIMEGVPSLCGRTAPKRFPFEDRLVWPDSGSFELILQRDQAFELGGSGKPSVNYTCVTTSPDFDEDEIVVVGADLPDIKNDTAFARIAVLGIEEIGEDEAAYDAIRKMEFVRYHVFPKGYMVRVSTTSFKEQVRVAKQAVRAGISFSGVGADYIARYKEIPGVRTVRIIFITDEALVNELVPNAKKTDDITKTLTHIMDGLSLDCSHCSMKPVCDEVDGMREEHLKALKKG